MPELPAVNGADAIRAFERLGFAEARVEGSHHMLKKPGHRYLLAVPVHGSETLKRGTLRSLIRAAGVTVEQFVAEL